MPTKILDELIGSLTQHEDDLCLLYAHDSLPIDVPCYRKVMQVLADAKVEIAFAKAMYKARMTETRNQVKNHDY
jgi:hypothetical protein